MIDEDRNAFEKGRIIRNNFLMIQIGHREKFID